MSARTFPILLAAALLPVIAVISPSASAATSQLLTNNTPAALCVQQPTLCITEYSNNVIDLEKKTDGNNQQIELYAQGPGMVTTGSTSWPFKDGSGLNSLFKGDAVVEIYFAGHSNCANNSVSSEGINYLVAGPCASGHAYLFVLDGYQIIDVGATNATDNGKGDITMVITSNNAAGEPVEAVGPGCGVSNCIWYQLS